MQHVRSLAGYPLFSGVSDVALGRLISRVKARRYASGEVILRAGDPAAELHMLATGAVRVMVAEGQSRRVLLVPPQSFGEMSVLSGSPVSATVVAQGDAETWAIAGEDLIETLADEPAFFRNVTSLLIDRLRHRTRNHVAALQPSVALLIVDGDPPSVPVLFGALHNGLRHYAPGSHALDARNFNIDATVALARQWRAESAGGQYLLLVVPPSHLFALRPGLEPGDLMLSVRCDPGAGQDTRLADSGEADAATVLLDCRTEIGSDSRWSHVLDMALIAAAAHEADSWSRDRYPVLDRLVRQIAHREVGLAMSVGAAAGLAHLGLLEVLEDEGVPLDFLCGSSMGGAVALGFAHFGSAAAASDAFCRLSAEFARSKGLQWLPQAGLVSKGRMVSIAAELFGRKTFAELPLPVAVVAADLVAGRRVVLDTGSIAAAACATAAIPGLFPPVRLGDTILVDGGLVTRVPVDLLTMRRCGLKLASVIRPDEGSTGELHLAADHMQATLDRPLGFRSVLGASWKLLGWWDSAVQAQKADLVVGIPTSAPDGFNFAAGKQLVERGRLVARAHLPSIHAAVKRMLLPGAP
jgi:NTE family protein